MKKLIFSSLLAIFAIGGAVAQTGWDINGTPYYCIEENETSCAGLVLYDSPTPPRNQIDPATYQAFDYIP